MLLLFSIAGLFAQDCDNGFRRAQEFRGDQVIYSEQNFFDSACEQPSLITRSYGTYSLGAEAGSGREIDFTFQKVTLMPKSEGVAESYRARALCGRMDWLVGEETDISGRRCDFMDNGADFPVPAMGDRRYGIVKEGVGQEALWFGRLSPEFDGSTPSRRPHFFDPLPYLRQVD